ncbi:bacteriohemerythrin [Geobacter sp. SVR]|uniref:bacteriohemerythrin n=1 Tax=Geobacter sp. SVR TaxID=2495594 RepID=UPI00143EF632|nr:bacteriohemerythrin [Geobacter sp. SVR]BCS55454.1 hemerythrin [Geobacter sp. SVR]GCF83457.1 hemerythrin [Geobacter sp. SVR]
MAIEWRESLATGNEEIDEQHKELLRHFDRMLTACKDGQGASELQKLLKFLNDYVVTHFNFEESLQQVRGYPDYEAHRSEHQSFIKKIGELESEISTQGVSVHNIIETNSLLLKWLLNHITVVDKKMGRFLQESEL